MIKEKSLGSWSSASLYSLIPGIPLALQASVSLLGNRGNNSRPHHCCWRAWGEGFQGSGWGSSDGPSKHVYLLFTREGVAGLGLPSLSNQSPGGADVSWWKRW